MLRTMLNLASVLIVMGACAPVMAGDCVGCSKVAKHGRGFCNACEKGKAFGVDLTSKGLYDALAGSAINKDKLKCPGCKEAAKTNGTCAHCKVTAANGKFYHSPVASVLARGTRVSAEKAASCSGCKTAHSEDGFCTGCSAGFVGGRMFKGEENYKAAIAAYNTLTKAASAVKKCEACAIAMVTDGTCEKCKVSFKAGKATG